MMFAKRFDKYTLFFQDKNWCLEVIRYLVSFNREWAPTGGEYEGQPIYIWRLNGETSQVIHSRLRHRHKSKWFEADSIRNRYYSFHPKEDFSPHCMRCKTMPPGEVAAMFEIYGNGVLNGSPSSLNQVIRLAVI